MTQKYNLGINHTHFSQSDYRAFDCDFKMYIIMEKIQFSVYRNFHLLLNRLGEYTGVSKRS